MVRECLGWQQHTASVQVCTGQCLIAIMCSACPRLIGKTRNNIFDNNNIYLALHQRRIENNLICMKNEATVHLVRVNTSFGLIAGTECGRVSVDG